MGQMLGWVGEWSYRSVDTTLLQFSLLSRRSKIISWEEHGEEGSEFQNSIKRLSRREGECMD